MLFFMCCYYGVYPWRVLRPRSTKTAASRNFTACFVRRFVRCAVRLSILRLPQNGPILRRPPRAEPHPSFERAGRFLPLIPI